MSLRKDCPLRNLPFHRKFSNTVESKWILSIRFWFCLNWDKKIRKVDKSSTWFCISTSVICISTNCAHEKLSGWIFHVSICCHRKSIIGPIARYQNEPSHLLHNFVWLVEEGTPTCLRKFWIIHNALSISAWFRITVSIVFSRFHGVTIPSDTVLLLHVSEITYHLDNSATRSNTVLTTLSSSGLLSHSNWVFL